MLHINKEYIIKFLKGRAYLGESISLNLKDVLPDQVGFDKPTYWTVRVKGYFEDEQRLACEILTYNSGDINFSQDQIDNAGELGMIKKITFTGVDTLGLLQTKNYKSGPKTIVHPKAVADPKRNYEKPESPTLEIPTRSVWSTRPAYFTQPELPIFERFEETIKVPFGDLEFHDKCIRFYAKVQCLPKPQEFQIKNAFLKKEFDAVKDYFKNALQLSHIAVHLKIEITGGKITNYTAYSKEIDRIDENIISKIRLVFGDYILKEKRTDDQYVHSLSDLMKEKVDLSAFYDNEMEFLEDLIGISKTKHYQHLRLLSKKHAFETAPLKFILGPFSFLFTVQTKSGYYVIWETLNTFEATYIWKYKSLSLLENEDFELVISRIKNGGKKPYLKMAPANFERIYHKNSTGDIVFEKWAAKLEDLLL